MTPSEQDSEVGTKIADNYHELIHTEEASSATASTNAFGWSCDEYSDVDYTIEEDSISVTLAWQASGDQDQDSGPCGTTIDGNATANIDYEGKVTFQDVSAEVDHGDDTDEDD